DRARKAARFELHNLLEAPPGGRYDLILCRNVLVYFSPEAVRETVLHLVSALAPGGAVLFGPMDLPAPPAGLSLGGPPELQVYRLPGPAQRRTSVKAAPAREPPPAPVRAPPQPPEPVALHLRALVHIERGEKAVAQR